MKEKPDHTNELLKKNIDKPLPKYLVECFIYINIITIYGTPTLIVGIANYFLSSSWLGYIALFLSPIFFSFVFGATAGVMSMPHQKAIVRGRFPRRSDHPVYGRRRLYGVCWTAVYYCKPIYWIILSVPFMKKIIFRAFGYRGSMDFVIYPDTWIRDLPLLDFGPGSYIANRATLGTNMVLSNGTILVDSISVGENAGIGHLAVLAPGVSLGARAQIGAAAVIGMGVRIAEDAHVGPATVVDHGSRVSRGAKLGTMSYLGLRSSIAEDNKVAPGSVISAHTHITGMSLLNATPERELIS